eukprot:CAMPEP_0117023382 /NCGR_PEP_ID=MMETSP0472-20121206/17459_1 /TAXON_ID=693140 ORGANISM="Tiarina fusus, Strain LIS" /NCGR_SAMPLE_ID=MMETSP0472 /ASSEMBLY_ACC=CAM_ASM_000603 /LENGTH=461 /DNA_ID=CAMNT_0004729489 /DNA_START=18 /DNA_END=1403 /DNA_ORIENTATION=+
MNTFAVFVFLSICGLASCAPQDQLITSLPGLPGGVQALNFSMYSGYVNINKEHNTNYFYWFVESQNDPANDPLLIWLNGGPGASSLMGFFTEHGPFRPNPDGTTLSLYEYSWNKIANIIYLEAPIGVGFSYSDDKLEYITNDNKTAIQNYQFLMNWFEMFPEYKANDFYITGESYGGKYCPELASVVLDGIQNGTTPWLNMKGVMVGNPGTESDWYGAPNEYAYLTFLYEHMIIPQAAYVNAYKTCGWSDFLGNCDGDYTNPTLQCKTAIIEALTNLPHELDAYDIYAPVCLDNPAAKQWTQYVSSWHPMSRYMPDNTTFYPCIDDYMTAYLNQPAVQQAIHVNPTNWAYIGKIAYIHEYKYSVVPLWERFISQTSWRILIYSGDVDSAVPTIGTQRWIECLGQPVINPWRPWYYNNQTAGLIQDYQGISFQTIKGAGHMVPYYLPAQGYAFYETWLLAGN